MFEDITQKIVEQYITNQEQAVYYAIKVWAEAYKKSSLDMDLFEKSLPLTELINLAREASNKAYQEVLGETFKKAYGVKYDC